MRRKKESKQRKDQQQLETPNLIMHTLLDYIKTACICAFTRYNPHIDLKIITYTFAAISNLEPRITNP